MRETLALLAALAAVALAQLCEDTCPQSGETCAVTCLCKFPPQVSVNLPRSYTCNLNAPGFYWSSIVHTGGETSAYVSYSDAQGRTIPLYSNPNITEGAVDVAPISAVIKDTSANFLFNVDQHTGCVFGKFNFTARAIKCKVENIVVRSRTLSWIQPANSAGFLNYTVTRNGAPAPGKLVDNSMFIADGACGNYLFDISTTLFNGLRCPASTAISIPLAFPPQPPTHLYAHEAEIQDERTHFSATWEEAVDEHLCGPVNYTVTIRNAMGPLGSFYLQAEDFTVDHGTVTPKKPFVVDTMTRGVLTYDVVARTNAGASMPSADYLFCNFVPELYNFSVGSIRPINDSAYYIQHALWQIDDTSCFDIMTFNVSVSSASRSLHSVLTSGDVQIIAHTIVLRNPILVMLPVDDAATVTLKTTTAAGTSPSREYDVCPHIARPPTNVAVNRITYDAITKSIFVNATWHEPDDVCKHVDYVVEFSDGSGFLVNRILRPHDYSLENGVVKPKLRFRLSNELDEGKTYYIAVSTQTEVGTSNRTIAEFYSPCYQRPIPPFSPFLLGVERDTVNLNATWRATVNCANVTYRVAIVGPTNKTVDVPVSQYSLYSNLVVLKEPIKTGLPTNAEYTFFVASVTDLGQSEYIGNLNFCPHIPAAPQQISTVDADTNGTAITVNFTFVPGNEVCKDIHYVAQIEEEGVVVYTQLFTPHDFIRDRDKLVLRYPVMFLLDHVYPNARYVFSLSSQSLAGASTPAVVQLPLRCELPPHPLTDNIVLSVFSQQSDQFSLAAAWHSENCPTTYVLAVDNGDTQKDISIPMDDLVVDVRTSTVFTVKPVVVPMSPDYQYTYTVSAFDRAVVSPVGVFCPHIPHPPSSVGFPRISFGFNLITLDLIWNVSADERCTHVAYYAEVTTDNPYAIVTYLTIQPGDYIVVNRTARLTYPLLIMRPVDLNSEYFVSLASQSVAGQSEYTRAGFFPPCNIFPTRPHILKFHITPHNNNTLSVTGSWEQAVPCRAVNYTFTLESEVARRGLVSISFTVQPTDVVLNKTLVILRNPINVPWTAPEGEYRYTMVATTQAGTGEPTEPDYFCTAQPTHVNDLKVLSAFYNHTLKTAVLSAFFTLPPDYACEKTTIYYAEITRGETPVYHFDSGFFPSGPNVSTFWVEHNTTGLEENAVYTLHIYTVTNTGRTETSTTFTFNGSEPDSGESGKGGMSNTTVAGIAVGASVGVLVIALAVYVYARRRRPAGYEPIA